MRWPMLAETDDTDFKEDSSTIVAISGGGSCAHRPFTDTWQPMSACLSRFVRRSSGLVAPRVRRRSHGDRASGAFIHAGRHDRIIVRWFLRALLATSVSV